MHEEDVGWYMAFLSRGSQSKNVYSCYCQEGSELINVNHWASGHTLPVDESTIPDVTKLKSMQNTTTKEWELNNDKRNPLTIEGGSCTMIIHGGILKTGQKHQEPPARLSPL